MEEDQRLRKKAKKKGTKIMAGEASASVFQPSVRAVVVDKSRFVAPAVADQVNWHQFSVAQLFMHITMLVGLESVPEKPHGVLIVTDSDIEEIATIYRAASMVKVKVSFWVAVVEMQKTDLLLAVVDFAGH